MVDTDELDAFRAENRVALTLVGHNIAQFDIRWLWKRAICLGIRPPSWWPVDARPWDQDRVQDTMLMWEGQKGRISQDRLARTLGLRGKGAIDGSMVADRWEAGEFEEIRLYCADDVTCVRQIWCRITGEDAPIEDEIEEVPVVATSAGTGDVFFDLAVDVPENATDDGSSMPCRRAGQDHPGDAHLRSGGCPAGR